ncbi:MAG: ArnT family glycosyltransferase, partial [Isosphaeraceae bacterium]
LMKLDPKVIPYGPPVTPVLIGLSSFVLGGPSDFAAMMPGIITGTLAIFLTALFCRQISGEKAALVAATLVAFSGMPIAFSRTALTDTPLACLWLWAMISGLKFLEKPGLKKACLMGVCVGLCQLTKYNGALTGLIIALTAVLDYFRSVVKQKPETAVFRRRILFGIFGALIAFLVYLPWLNFVENHGGYRSLLNHHSGYVKPLSSWPTNLKMQLVQAWAFEQYLPLKIALAIALLLVLIVFQRQESKTDKINTLKNLSPGHWLALSPILISLILVPNASWLIALVKLPELMKSEKIGQRLLFVWLVVMSVITPVYHPYARLWLPALMASYCMIGLVLADFIAAETRQKQTGRSLLANLTVYLLLPALISLAITNYHFKANSSLSKSIYAGRGVLKREVQRLGPEISKILAGGRVEMLVSPAVRWHLAGNLETGGATGALASLPDLKNWSGVAPLLLDQSLVNEAEMSELSESLQKRMSDVARPMPGLKETTTPTDFSQNRGLITTLDIQPDVPLRSTLPKTGLILVR